MTCLPKQHGTPSIRLNLTLRDTPVHYEISKGPSANFTENYSEREIVPEGASDLDFPNWEI